jgi:hypothetical protein
MSPGRILRLFLAAALLCAQQAALSHELWHLLDQGSQPAQQQLCGQHDALGTVAGAVDTAVPVFADERPSAPEYRSIVLPEANSPGLAPSSRGPPASL